MSYTPRTFIQNWRESDLETALRIDIMQTAESVAESAEDSSTAGIILRLPYNLVKLAATGAATGLFLVYSMCRMTGRFAEQEKRNKAYQKNEEAKRAMRELMADPNAERHSDGFYR